MAASLQVLSGLLLVLCVTIVHRHYNGSTSNLRRKPLPPGPKPDPMQVYSPLQLFSIYLSFFVQKESGT